MAGDRKFAPARGGGGYELVLNLVRAHTRLLNLVFNYGYTYYLVWYPIHVPVPKWYWVSGNANRASLYTVSQCKYR